jgi:hypothetical protein
MSSNNQVIKDQPPPYPDLELGQLPPSETTPREAQRQENTNNIHKQQTRCCCIIWNPVVWSLNECCTWFGIVFLAILVISFILIMIFLPWMLPG